MANLDSQTNTTVRVADSGKIVNSSLYSLYVGEQAVVDLINLTGDTPIIFASNSSVVNFEYVIIIIVIVITLILFYFLATMEILSI